MRLTHVIGRAVAWGVAVAVLVGLGGLLLIEAVEQANRLPVGRAPGAFVSLLAGRAVLLARDVAPVLVAVGLGLGLGELRRRGGLLALGVAGVSASRLRGALVLACGAVAALVVGGIELAAPAARDLAATSAATLSGRPLALGGGWASTAEGLIRVGAVEDGALAAVTLVTRDDGGLLRRVDVSRLTAEGPGWRPDGVRAVTLAGGAMEEVTPASIPLPPAEVLQLLARRLDLGELGLAELAVHPAPAAVGWLRTRALGLLCGLGWGWALGGLLLCTRLSTPQAVVLAAVLGGAWQLAALAVAGGSFGGWLPAGLALGGGALAGLRPVDWRAP
ncbi:MAG: hypothetical protein H6739_21295 [Alphaproteobacteria bacterium]|nr:hypothetical protein [Alphaproteobacteria bacterium]